MRRIASSGLIGLGAFLIVAAALIKFYAYPTVATVPTNFESTTLLEAKDATLYNASTGVTEPVDLSIESYTVADSTVDAGDGNVVWISRSTVLLDTVEGASCESEATEEQVKGCFQRSTEVTPFDANSGAGVPATECDCDSYYDTSDPVENDEATGLPKVERVNVDFTGQVLKFPFDTQKVDYDQWDTTTGKAWPAVYEGEEKIDGLKVYKFVQTITDQVVPGNAADNTTRPVPGAIFGLEDATVDANYLYSVTRTFYIEPITGAPVNRVEERDQRLILGDDTSTAVTALEGTIQYTDEQVADSVDQVKFKSFLLGGLPLLFPIVALLLGLIAIAGGILLGRGGSNDAGSSTDQRQLVNA